jgi:A/G-specific adenine glycosylase
MTIEQSSETGSTYRNEFPVDHLGTLISQWQPLFEKYGVCEETLTGFSSIIKHHFQHYGRQFSWRSEITPYRVVVSEIMLQQTQTSRVEQKFERFIEQFSGFEQLARAEFSEVLGAWKGLGYNRRARYLHDIGALVTEQYGGELPDEPDVLQRFSGIGRATAASICVFAFNKAYPFVETNIRTVFIHFFFSKAQKIDDPSILDLVKKTMDQSEPRRWFYGLMDYGVMLKKTVGNLNRQSAQYTRQSRFEGSDRQVRGRILQALLDERMLSAGELASRLGEDEERVLALAGALIREGLIKRRDELLTLV